MNSALSYFSSKLAGFSQNTFSLSASGKTSNLVANDVLIFSLPSSAIIDTRSLRIAFNLTVISDAAARAPGDLQKLISRVEVLVGGQSVGAQVNHGLLVSMKERLYGSSASVTAHPDIVRAVGDYSTIAMVTTDEEKQVGSELAAGSAVLTTASVPYIIELSCNFLSTCQPRYLDASLMNQIQVRLTLAPNSVLSVSTNLSVPTMGMYAANANPVEFDTPVTGLSATYQLDNVVATMSAISFASSEYDVLLADQMQSQGFISIPFRNTFGFRQSHTGSSKFNISTRSLDRIIYGFLYTGASEAGTTGRPMLKNSSVINSPSLVPGFLVEASHQASKYGSGLERYVGAWETYGVPSKEFTVQCSINNSFLPQAPVGAAQAGAITEVATGVKLPFNTNPLSRLTTDFVNCFSFCMQDSENFRVASGQDCRGSQVTAQLLTSGNFDIGSTPSWDSIIFAECTSEMRLSVGRSCTIVN